MGQLVRIIKQHIKEYLEDMLTIIKEYWKSPYTEQIIVLIEEISIALQDEFKVSHSTTHTTHTAHPPPTQHNTHLHLIAHHTHHHTLSLEY